MAWITENYLLVIAFVGALLAAAKVGAKFSKTTKDDEIIAKIDEAFDTVEDLVDPKK